MLPDKPFLIIGHRGAAGLEPENTLRSFRRAVALGVDAVELDVYAAHGELIVIHDDTLERTTNGNGPLAGIDWESLRALDAGAGEAIPTLAEALAVLPCAVNIELKGTGTAQPLAPYLSDRDSARVFVSSFRHDELATFQHLRPDVALAPLYSRRPPVLDALPVSAPWAVNVSRRLATPPLIAAIRRAGYRCLVYTVNDPEEAHRLRAAGVSGVFTDYPDRVRAD
jgi:glycerophosphoryl diester phosphodiesterase